MLYHRPYHLSLPKASKRGFPGFFSHRHCFCSPATHSTKTKKTSFAHDLSSQPWAKGKPATLRKPWQHRPATDMPFTSAIGYRLLQWRQPSVNGYSFPQWREPGFLGFSFRCFAPSTYHPSLPKASKRGFLGFSSHRHCFCSAATHSTKTKKTSFAHDLSS